MRPVVTTTQLNHAGGRSSVPVARPTSSPSRHVRTWRHVFEFVDDLPETLRERLVQAPDDLLESGTLLKSGNRCTVAHLEVDGRAYVLKRYNLKDRFHTLAHALLPTRASRCWRFGRMLNAAGLASPRPLAFLEERLGPLRGRCYLLTEAIAAGWLYDYVRDPARTDEELSLCAGRFAHLWHRLGELRLTHGDAKSYNFLVDASGRIWTIDLDGMQQHHTTGGFERARRRDRQRFFRDFHDRPDLATWFRNAVNHTDQSSRRVEPAAPRSDARSPQPDSEDERFIVNPKYSHWLERAGLDGVSAVMASRSGLLMRRKDDRENWRIDLTDDDGRPRVAYLKKHRAGPPRMLARLLGARSDGRVEAEQIAALDAAGIPTMSCIAYGEQTRGNGALESCLLTEELTGFEQLDEFFPKRFSAGGGSDSVERKKLIDKVAEVARDFHAARFNHRDFYTCHFFIRETDDGTFDVRLIDLQRVERRRFFRGRWLVKDLAQLAYSMPRALSIREQMRFAKQYFQTDRLTQAHKRLLMRVLRRRDRMQRRLGNYL